TGGTFTHELRTLRGLLRSAMSIATRWGGKLRRSGMWIGGSFTCSKKLRVGNSMPLLRSLTGFYGVASYRHGAPAGACARDRGICDTETRREPTWFLASRGALWREQWRTRKLR